MHDERSSPTKLKSDPTDVQVLMNPEDPFYADGVDPSLRAVALRVGEASELEAAISEERGDLALHMLDSLSALAQHLKRFALQISDIRHYVNFPWR